MERSEQVRDVAGLCSVMAVATVSTFHRQLLSAQQCVVKRIHTTSHWFQVVGVARVQGYQAPVAGKRGGIKALLVSLWRTQQWGFQRLRENIKQHFSFPLVATEARGHATFQRARPDLTGKRKWSP